MRLLRRPYVLILWLVALLDASVLYAYFNWTGVFLGSPAWESRAIGSCRS